LTLSHTPQHRSHLADDLAIVAIDGFVGVVGGEEPDVAVLHGEGFDSGFAIDHGSDDVALVAILLSADDDVVAVADSGINHGVTFDLEHEEIALADEGLWEWEGLFDVLFGEDGCTCCDLAKEGDVGGGFYIDIGVGLGGQSAALGDIALDVALGFQDLELVFDRGWGGEPCCFADLAHRGGVAVLGDGVLDDGQDGELALGEVLGRALCGGLFSHGYRVT